MRMTSQRSLMLEYLRYTKEHPTAIRVYEEMKGRLPYISAGTVYRNISFFKDLGLIRELNISGNGRFDGNTSDHGHFLCKTCAKVIDVEELEISDFVDAIEQDNGVNIDTANVNFVGTCGDCL